MQHVLRALMPENALALEVSMATGMRIGDVLALKPDKLRNDMRIREVKTGKTRRVWLPEDLRRRCALNASRDWVFPARSDLRKHRSRQAVWKDVKRAARAFRVDVNLSTHSARKVWAVEFMRRHGNIARLQKNFGHESVETTMIYAIADVLAARRSAR